MLARPALAARKPRRLSIRRSAFALGAPTAQPLRCALLAVDVAAVSGTAVYIGGVLRAYDEVATEAPTRRDSAIRELLDAGEVRGMPVVLALEVPFGGHQSAALALTKHVGLWRDSWRRLGRSGDSVVELTVNEWRRALFGRRALSRMQAREHERQVALATARRDMPRTPHHHIGTDAAAAICLGQVLIRSSGVRARLGCELVRREIR